MVRNDADAFPAGVKQLEDSLDQIAELALYVPRGLAPVLMPVAIDVAELGPADATRRPDGGAIEHLHATRIEQLAELGGREDLAGVPHRGREVRGRAFQALVCAL